jgi:hypothetical protein
MGILPIQGRDFFRHPLDTSPEAEKGIEYERNHPHPLMETHTAKPPV